jgi:hypothetical protein
VFGIEVEVLPAALAGNVEIDDVKSAIAMRVVI